MSDYYAMFQEGDKVFYVGSKFKSELSREGRPIAGVIHAAVRNQPGTWVIEFADTKKHDSYIVHESLLSRAQPERTEKVASDKSPDKNEKKYKPEKPEGPLVEVRRKRAEAIE
jgi:hypothetical protein